MLLLGLLLLLVVGLHRCKGLHRGRVDLWKNKTDKLTTKYCLYNLLLRTNVNIGLIIVRDFVQRPSVHSLTHLGLFQTSCYCRAELK